jgi:hypothetical protein
MPSADRARRRSQSGTWTAIVAGLTWGFTALAERRDRRI